MKSYYNHAGITIYNGNCLEVLPELEVVDAVVTDSPYGLTANKKGGTGKASLNLNFPAGRARISTGGGFMGQKWDQGVPGVEVWEKILAVLKPGGHLLAFGGTRTFHRLICAIEDAGFEIRDCLLWVYASGFPKSRNALKPAWEPITLARKPLEGTVAQNVLKHGTGGLNIDECRVHSDDAPRERTYRGNGLHCHVYAQDKWTKANRSHMGNYKSHPAGRWPSNVIHDGSDEVLAEFPQTKSESKKKGNHKIADGRVCREFDHGSMPTLHGNFGSAARFFYTAKASPADRNTCGADNLHPTVKPLSLMSYLCRLITPPGGVVLDPFLGSGSTLVAAKELGFRAIGIEIEEKYCEIAVSRLAQGVLDFGEGLG